jgi:hypothetical protein
MHSSSFRSDCLTAPWQSLSTKGPYDSRGDETLFSFCCSLSHSLSHSPFALLQLRGNIDALAKTYRKSAQYLELQEILERHPVESGKHQLTLTPTLFWYDNTHICDTAHYRDFIFHPSYKMVAKGGFVEDKLSPVLKRTVERLGLKEGHSRFGCYLLDDRSGMFFTGHLDGGSYMTAAKREELLESQSSTGST